jgi:hypothetical protein
MLKYLIAFIALGSVVTEVAAQIDLGHLRTRAEGTDFVETTRYDEVVAFMAEAAAAAPDMVMTSFGFSVEGRALPLVVIGGGEGTPEDVIGTERLRVFVMANIHAGEVAGKEAALQLIRELAEGRHVALTERIVLLIAPIYNADGNERINLYNRPRQHGPIGGMGTRGNAQERDLNRDNMKLDTPEARSLAGLLTAYDPHVLFDLHTTNGTLHAYHLTYSPPLHPATPAPIDDLLREDLFPAVTNAIRDARGWETYYYGNLPWPWQQDWPPGWYTFDHRPRFTTNYAGIRNRIGILSEAYSYATFRERVEATYLFVVHSLAYIADHAERIASVTQAADERPVAGEQIAVRGALERSSDPVPILMGGALEERHPFTGEVILRRTDEQRVEMLYEYGRFSATHHVTAPEVYAVLPTADRVIDRLLAHGIHLDVLERETTLEGERFAISEVVRAERPFQGRHEHAYEGEWVRASLELPVGTVLVSTAQPLGRLAVLLLEPASDDGLAAWGFFEGANAIPVLRLFAPVQ